jgi:hypothetical protein
VSSYYQEDKTLVNEINAAKINSRLYSSLPEFKLFHNANSNKTQSWYSAPTQSLLQKWLREEGEGIIVTVEHWSGWVFPNLRFKYQVFKLLIIIAQLSRSL